MKCKIRQLLSLILAILLLISNITVFGDEGTKAATIKFINTEGSWLPMQEKLKIIDLYLNTATPRAIKVHGVACLWRLFNYTRMEHTFYNVWLNDNNGYSYQFFELLFLQTQ